MFGIDRLASRSVWSLNGSIPSHFIPVSAGHSAGGRLSGEIGPPKGGTMKLARPLLLAVAAGAAIAAGFVSASSGASGATKPIPLLRVGFSPAVSAIGAKDVPGTEGLANLSLERLLEIGSDGKVRPLLAR